MRKDLSLKCSAWKGFIPRLSGSLQVPNKYWIQKKFGSEKNYGSEEILGTKKLFGPQKIWGSKKFGVKM